MAMNHRISCSLASTPQGQAYYCACKNRVTLRFKERWFAMGRAELPNLRDCLVRLRSDADLRNRLVDEALNTAVARGLPPGDVPTFEDLGEMLDLIDSAALVLEAQEIASASSH
jgi:hypothetical protein